MFERLRYLDARGRALLGLVAAIVVVGALLAGTLIAGGDDDPDQVDTAAPSTTASSTTSSSSSSTSSTTSTTSASNGSTTTVQGRSTTTTTRRSGGSVVTTTPTTGVVTTTTARPACATPNSSYTGTLSSLFTQYRANQNLPAMQRSPGLDEMAQQWAEEMACDGEMKHRPAGEVQNRVLAACVTCVRSAENVAYNFNLPDPPTSAWNGWLGSPPHLENIRKPYTGVYGFGAAKGANGQWYYAQNFGWYS